MPATRWTRRELYERIWATPVARVAQELGISGAGLRKACLRHDIPVPPRGYWARKTAGQKVTPPPLPHPGKGDEAIEIDAARFTGRRTPRRPPVHSEAVEAQRAREDQPDSRIEVPSTLPERPHPWAQNLRKELRRVHADGFGLCTANAAAGIVKVHIANGSFERTLRIIDALGRAVKARKIGTVDLRDENYGGLRYLERRLQVDGVALQLRFRERTTRRRLSPAEQRQQHAAFGGVYEYRPTGTLRLTVIAHDGSYGGPERQFQDTTVRPIEERLNDVIVALTEIAAEVRVREKEREDARRRQWELERHAAQVRRQREAEQARERALLVLTERWDAAGRLRAFVAAARATGIVPGPDGAPTELDPWCAWALSKADAIDPLSEASENGIDH